MSRKKEIYKIETALRKYLSLYSRNIKLPLNYTDLQRYTAGVPLLDKNGNDTLWETVCYSPTDTKELNIGLTFIYSVLKAAGDTSVMEHLRVERIDYCSFGNTNPFRVRIVNSYNDNYDYFYVKVADSSRIYGLELEHILSPNRINYLVNSQTIIEEHIAGIPGDQFVSEYLGKVPVNEIRLAKEFVKFNERSLVRFLGDMRSYNFVIDITPDFDDVQYRLRAIDFDQQSYEGKKSLYMPQYFKENTAFVNLCMKHLNEETVKQYQQEERALIAMRLKTSRYRIKDLLDIMIKNNIAPKTKVHSLRKELALHYDNQSFERCVTMGELVKKSLKIVLRKHFA